MFLSCVENNELMRIWYKKLENTPLDTFSQQKQSKTQCGPKIYLSSSKTTLTRLPLKALSFGSIVTTWFRFYKYIYVFLLPSPNHLLGLFSSVSGFVSTIVCVRAAPQEVVSVFVKLTDRVAFVASQCGRIISYYEPFFYTTRVMIRILSTFFIQ